MTATAEALERTYRPINRVVFHVLEPRDITCARFEGNFWLSLNEGQARKHDFVLDELEIGPGSRFLDVGCGYGALLEAAQQRGAVEVGINNEAIQAESCRQRGLNVITANCLEVLGGQEPARLPMEMYDGISCVEAVEHLCGTEEILEGRQEEIYQDFFQKVGRNLVDGGRMYLQSMVLGENAPDIREVSLAAPKFSREYIAARLRHFYLDSWAPDSFEQLAECAEDFDVIKQDDGTEDYIETMKRWSMVWELNPKNIWAGGPLLLESLFDSDLRMRIDSMRKGYNRQAFETGMLRLARIVLQKKSEIFKPENAAKIAPYLIDKLTDMGLPVRVDAQPDESLEAVYLRDEAILYVHQDTGKVLVLDQTPGMVASTPESGRLWVHGKRWGETTRLYTEAASKDLNSKSFWRTWSNQFMSSE